MAGVESIVLFIGDAGGKVHSTEEVAGVRGLRPGRAGSGFSSLTCILGSSAPLIEQLRNKFEMALRAFGDGSLFGEASGPGPPEVLALHGWGRRGSDFRQSLQDISYIALDLPGFGATPVPEVASGAAGYARAIEPVLTELSDRVVLVGHSFGGRVAVHLAATHPGRFDGLILTGVPLVKRKSGRNPPPLFRMARWAARLGIMPASAMERVRRRYGSADYRAATGVMREVLVAAVNESYEDQLALLQLPVLLLWGADDAEVPVEVAERAAALLNGVGAEARLVVEPGVGHLLPTSSPGTLRRAVDEMLAQVRDP